jgi:beta-lactamase regulating signal transducer with metallopeptidase domain
MDLLLAAGAQHLWQSAVFVLLACAVLKVKALDARAQSWLWLGVFALAALMPLLVLLPATEQFGGATVDVSGDRADGSVSMVAQLTPVIALVWLLGFAVSLLRLALAWQTARRLRDEARHAPRLRRVVERTLPRTATIKVSTAIRSPMVVGLAHPCILVPEMLLSELSESALRDILHHEVAHVLRRDLWLSLGQHLLAAVYWWSPCMRIAGTRLNLAREMACDAYAAAQSNGSGSYARSLLATVERALSVAQPRLALASGIFDSREDLARRIEGLLNQDSADTRTPRAFALVVCTLLSTCVMLALLATPRMGRAALEEVSPSLQTSHVGALQQPIEFTTPQRPDESDQLLRHEDLIIDVASHSDEAAPITRVETEAPVTKALVKPHKSTCKKKKPEPH